MYCSLKFQGACLIAKETDTNCTVLFPMIIKLLETFAFNVDRNTS